MISCPMTKVLKNLFISCGCSSCQLESVIVWAAKTCSSASSFLFSVVIIIDTGAPLLLL